MPSVPYSTQFMDVHDSSGESYVVPDGFVAVIQNVTLFVGSQVTPGDLFVQVYTNGTGRTFYSYGEIAPSVSYSESLDTKQVLQAGDGFTFTAVLDLLPISVDVGVSGWLLTAIP